LEAMLPPTLWKICFLLTLFLVLFQDAHSLTCHKVNDGDVKGQDIQVQAETDRLSANFQDFSDKNSKGSIKYEYAVVTEGGALSTILNAKTGVCRNSPGFRGNSPDTINFVSIGSSTSFTVTKLSLVKGWMYFIIIKATSGGQTVYTNSNGVIIATQVVITDNSSDDDDLTPLQAGMTALAVILFCLLLLLLLLLIVVAKGKGEDKYTTTVHRNENVDKI